MFSYAGHIFALYLGKDLWNYFTSDHHDTLANFDIVIPISCILFLQTISFFLTMSSYHD